MTTEKNFEFHMLEHQHLGEEIRTTISAANQREIILAGALAIYYAWIFSNSRLYCGVEAVEQIVILFPELVIIVALWKHGNSYFRIAEVASYIRLIEERYADQEMLGWERYRYKDLDSLGRPSGYTRDAWSLFRANMTLFLSQIACWLAMISIPVLVLILQSRIGLFC